MHIRYDTHIYRFNGAGNFGCFKDYCIPIMKDLSRANIK